MGKENEVLSGKKTEVIRESEEERKVREDLRKRQKTEAD
jgi:hypothetical protein